MLDDRCREVLAGLPPGSQQEVMAVFDPPAIDANHVPISLRGASEDFIKLARWYTNSKKPKCKDEKGLSNFDQVPDARSIPPVVKPSEDSFTV